MKMKNAENENERNEKMRPIGDRCLFQAFSHNVNGKIIKQRKNLQKTLRLSSVKLNSTLLLLTVI
jgi:hypothetical protein